MDITLDKLYELYVDTLNKLGTFLLHENDEIIEYNIFEEFDIGLISFLHEDSLSKLLAGKLIDKNEMEEVMNLRNKVLELQNKNEWNIKLFKTSKNWIEVLMLADKINERKK